MVAMALRKLGLRCPRRQVAMVGDRLYTDIRMGRRAGLTSILLLSGETQAQDLEHTRDKPDYVFESIRDLAEAMKRSARTD
jgi:NagD protein